MDQSVSKLKQLPEWCIEVPPYHLPNDALVLVCSKSSTTDLLECFVLLENETLLQNTFSATRNVFHACSQSSPLYQDTSFTLPILCNDSKSTATIKHLLDIFIKSIPYLHPNQTAVIGFDWPLRAFAQKIKWFQATAYSQQELVSMLGALHIKMVMLSCLGDWHQDSGWTIVLLNSGATSSGNDSLHSGHDVGKIKYVHQVSASTLYRLMTNAFEDSKEEGCTLYFVKWRASNELGNPLFNFGQLHWRWKWIIYFFLWSVRSSNFKLYVESIRNFLPWIFAFE